ncbi:flagellin [Priestia megaterium]|uniref:flagellin N-terminal helical domain-containing protein n=1 Tax=Priestia megaterium TaxID=1404 RepID=UPI0021D6605B|nr:flagellin [Priestia megaterium]MCU7745580.1 flagellin [Priestia megaterium]
MRINHNIAALNTYRQFNNANNAQSKSMEKLSSGLRINSAADDAAGLAISEKMRGQVRGLDMASKNAQDGVSLIQTAEGALNETHDILQRMRELANQASNDTNTTSDRGEIQKEINSLTSEINRIGNTTEFNTQKLLNGDKDGAGSSAVTAVQGKYAVGVTDTVTAGITIDSVNIKGADIDEVVTNINDDDTLKAKYVASAGTGADSGKLILTQVNGEESASAPTIAGGNVTTQTAGVVGKSAVAADDSKSLKLQVGANENQSLTLDISDMRASALGLTTSGTGDKLAVTDGTSNTTTEQALDVSNHASASAAVTTIQTAIDKVSAERSKLGANQNRLEHTIKNLSTSSENLTAAESRIRDVDYALAA